MNGDDLKAQQTKAVRTNLNAHERVSGRWHASGQEIESLDLRQHCAGPSSFTRKLTLDTAIYVRLPQSVLSGSFKSLHFGLGTALVRIASLTPASETPAGIPRTTHVSVALHATSSIDCSGAEFVPTADGSCTLVQV